MAEVSERTKEGEERQAQGSLEDFRTETIEQHGPEGLEDKPKDLEDKPKDAETEERSESGMSDHLDLEGTRRQIQEEFGEDGLRAYDHAIQAGEGEADPRQRATTVDTPREQGEAEASPEVEGGGEQGNFGRNDNQVVVTEQERSVDATDRTRPDSTAVEISDPNQENLNPIEKETKSGPGEIGHGGASQDVVLGDEVGGYNLGPNQTVLTERREGPKEGEEDVSGSKHARPGPNENVDGLDVKSESGRCEKTFAAVEYMESNALYVPERFIPEHTKEDVLKVTLAREHEDWREYSFYTTHEPGQRIAYIDLKQVDAQKGEQFRIVSVEKHEISDFVDEYNVVKPRGLENTNLSLEGEKLFLRVDGVSVPVEDVHLRAQEGNVVMEGIVGNSAVKIANGPDGTVMRLQDHSRVTELSADGKVVLTYQRTRHDSGSHRRVVSVVGRQNPEGEKEHPHLGRIEAAPESEGKNESFRLAMDDEIRESIKKALQMARTPDEYRKKKGDSAEEIIKEALPVVGFTLVADHPHNNDLLKTGSDRTGPDFLVRRRESDVLGYLEAKWWDNTPMAFAKGERQTKSDLRRHPTFHGQKVTEGFVAVLDWKLNSDDVFLQLKPVALNKGESELI